MVRVMTVAARRWQQHVIIGCVGILFGILTLFPLLWPVFGFTGMKLQVISRGLEVFTSAQSWILLARTLGLALAVVSGALLLGTPMGLLLARTDIAGRRMLLFAQSFPMFLPPFLLALGWFYLLGRQGFFGGETSAGLLFNPLGDVAVLSLAFAPVVTALVALGLWNLDPGLEEAARTVAEPYHVLIGILLPGVWPSVALACILVFALAFSELGVPMFLRVDVYPAAVFSRLGGVDYDPVAALFLSLPLVPVAVSLVVLEHQLFKDRPLDVIGLRYRSREPLPLGVWRGSLSAACWTITMLSYLPLAALAVKAWSGGGFDQIDRWIGNSIFNSLLGAGIAATAIVCIGAVLGHGLARNLAVMKLLDLLGILAFVVPSVLLGTGLIVLWNRPETRFIYGSMAIIILGYIARYGIIGIRTMAVAVEQSPLSLEQAATAFGAGYARRFIAVVLPLHRRALAAAWFMALVFCMRDLETAVLYYPPGREPMTVRIFTLEANGPEAVIAGLAIIHVVITAVVLMIGALLVLHRDRK